MPPLIVAAAIGAGIGLAWRVISAEQKRLTDMHRRAAEAAGPVPLEQDPKTGIYRPKSD